MTDERLSFREWYEKEDPKGFAEWSAKVERGEYDITDEDD